MKQFNKIFKQIILENELSINRQNCMFPTAFSFADYGLEFIYDIMPTFGSQYIWHTLDDLKNIPELVSALKNTDQNILLEIADGFQDAAAAEQQYYPDEVISQPKNFREIASWIRQLKDNKNEMLMETQDLNIHDSSCFNTVPNVVKEVRPRAYRRGLKALSLANRTKFNKQRISAAENETYVSQTDKINKIKQKTNIQQPISQSVIMPAPGVDRPVGLNRTDKHNTKNTFSNIVYKPSITQITKQNAKKRCLLKRKNNKIYTEQNNSLEFTTNYAQTPVPTIKSQPVIPQKPQQQKQLCVICKSYIQPKQIKLKNGNTAYVCPKCGIRMQSSNY